MAYTAELALFLLLIIPLAAAALIPLVGSRPNVREGVTLWRVYYCLRMSSV